MAGRVTWRYDATTQPWLRLLYLVGAAALHGLFLLLAVALLAVVALVLRGGSNEARLLVVVLALVGGPASLLYLLPMLRDPDQRPSFHPPEMTVGPGLSLRRRAALGGLGAAGLGAAWWVDPRLAGAVLAVGLLAGLTAVLVATRGSINPERAVLATAAREFDLNGVRGYRTRRLGPVALVRFAAAARPGRLGRAPSWVVVPTGRLADVEATLDTVVAEADPAAGRDPNPQVQLAAGALALTFLGVGAAALLTVGAGVGWYVATLCWLFGGLLLLVAREG